MFLKKKKIDHINDLSSSLKKNDDRKTQIILDDALTNVKDEDILGCLCGILDENQAFKFFMFVKQVHAKFPESIFPLRVFLANYYYLPLNQLDLATYFSREYLRSLKEMNVLDNLEKVTKTKFYPIIEKGIARAFLLMSSTYTENGARSYSLRLLEYVISMSLSDDHKLHLMKELENIKEELKDSRYQEKDNLWESFFSTYLLGKKEDYGSFDKLLSRINKNVFPQFLIRLNLLESNYRFNKPFNFYKDELFLLEYKTENNANLLG